MPTTKPRKEGVDSALEFTKFVITMDSVQIAFITGASFLEKVDQPFEKWLAASLLGALAISLGAGIFVYMRAVTMLGEGNYDLRDRALRMPGLINVLAFVIGSIGVAGLAVSNFFVP